MVDRQCGEDNAVLEPTQERPCIYREASLIVVIERGLAAPKNTAPKPSGACVHPRLAHRGFRSLFVFLKSGIGKIRSVRRLGLCTHVSHDVGAVVLGTRDLR